MKIEMKCVATRETTGSPSKRRPVGYVRKVHNYKAGDFCVHCDKARR